MTEKIIINNLLLGVTGSVGVLVLPDYIRLLRENIAENVHVMMSHSAKKFVTPYTLRLYSGNYVFTDSFDITDDVRVPHIELTRKCDVFVIMPATANIIGKVANGICDDLISTAVMACKAPVVFVPAMNPTMWFSKANQKNVLTLKELGHHVILPSEGYEISDMKPSFGSMPEFEVIANFLKDIVNKR
ncbi:flavoprotein [Candidatus Nitrosotenuis aquarius]|uniref:flavoprotein n=1 Tax=Candidatus Nitrosotenuis aquarius TaxID=1846278 RepID=UPI000C1E0A74|nr:flavoprotein [Candidatus Nitrosotenuis aquarius]